MSINSINLSIASKNFAMSLTSSVSCIRIKVRRFNSVAFLAGPWEAYADSNFCHISRAVLQPRIYFSSDGLIAKIKSDLVFLSPTRRQKSVTCRRFTGSDFWLNSLSRYIFPCVILYQQRFYLHSPCVEVILREQFNAHRIGIRDSHVFSSHTTWLLTTK